MDCKLLVVSCGVMLGIFAFFEGCFFEIIILTKYLLVMVSNMVF